MQYVLDRALRLLPGVGNGLDGLVSADRGQVELVDKEVVWVLGLDVPVGPYVGGKVAQIECDDDPGRLRPLELHHSRGRNRKLRAAAIIARLCG